MKFGDWIRIDVKTESISCKRCGAVYELLLPPPLGYLVAVARRFAKGHGVGKCRRKLASKKASKAVTECLVS